MSADATRSFLRHTVATLAYRANKATKGAPPEFASFAAGEKPRTPVKILSHMGDLLDWALSMATGEKKWKENEPASWDDEVKRFFAALERFDAFLASGAPLECTCEKLFQGPVADALSHTGQLAMLRRLAGAPIKAENYFKAQVEIGRVGPDQTPPKFEFD
ncbi:MAG: hypothetical protein L6R30_07490 [Thermoanaerobaculia bacterium]|nr:hypothetical protein [Thermoanaerobaculia bacterium]